MPSSSLLEAEQAYSYVVRPSRWVRYYQEQETTAKTAEQAAEFTAVKDWWARLDTVAQGSTLPLGPPLTKYRQTHPPPRTEQEKQEVKEGLWDIFAVDPFPRIDPESCEAVHEQDGEAGGDVVASTNTALCRDVANFQSACSYFGRHNENLWYLQKYRAEKSYLQEKTEGAGVKNELKSRASEEEQSFGPHLDYTKCTMPNLKQSCSKVLQESENPGCKSGANGGETNDEKGMNPSCPAVDNAFMDAVVASCQSSKTAFDVEKIFRSKLRECQQLLELEKDFEKNLDLGDDLSFNANVKNNLRISENESITMDEFIQKCAERPNELVGHPEPEPALKRFRARQEAFKDKLKWQGNAWGAVFGEKDEQVSDSKDFGDNQELDKEVEAKGFTPGKGKKAVTELKDQIKKDEESGKSKVPNNLFFKRKHLFRLGIQERALHTCVWEAVTEGIGVSGEGGDSIGSDDLPPDPTQGYTPALKIQVDNVKKCFKKLAQKGGFPDPVMSKSQIGSDNAKQKEDAESGDIDAEQETTKSYELQAQIRSIKVKEGIKLTQSEIQEQKDRLGKAAHEFHTQKGKSAPTNSTPKKVSLGKAAHEFHTQKGKSG